MYWDGKPFGTARSSLSEAEGYLDKLRVRWPAGVGALVDNTNGAAAPKRHRGGPYQYSLPDGTTGSIQANSQKEAREVLARQLKRKRIPKGTVWGDGK